MSTKDQPTTSTSEFYARFAIDPTVPGNHGQSDPEVQAALAEEGRKILAEVKKIHTAKHDAGMSEQGLSGDAVEEARHISQYHTASGRALDFRGRPLWPHNEYDQLPTTQVYGQYHTSAGHPLDNQGRPVLTEADKHYNDQVRQVGVAHQEARPNQTMLHQYHTNTGVQLNEFGLPFTEATPDAKANELPADKSSPKNVEAAKKGDEKQAEANNAKPADKSAEAKAAEANKDAEKK